MTNAIRERGNAFRTRKTVARSIAVGVGAIALALGAPLSASANTPVATGEWDIVAVSQAQNPDLQSFNHETEVWDTVGEFAVGSGKTIEAEGTTPVTGGGIRIVNGTSSASNVSLSISLDGGDSLVITDEEGSTVFDSSEDAVWSLGSIAAGATVHGHYTWEFTSVDAESNVNVAVNGAGFSGDSTTYAFTF